MNEFQIIGRVERVERVATGNSIRERNRLIDQYGRGRWRKLKGFARVILPGGKRP